MNEKEALLPTKRNFCDCCRNHRGRKPGREGPWPSRIL